MTSQNQDKTGSKMNLKMRPLPDARSHAGGWLVSLVPEPRASRLYVDICTLVIQKIRVFLQKSI